jgi:plasmid stabilization system protein ParE
MAKRIIYTNRAFDDIDRIIEFNNRRNKSTTYSRKFLTSLRKRVQQLPKQPFIGLKTDEPDTLLLIWNKYYVFYEVNESTIFILAIYHQKENVSR